MSDRSKDSGHRWKVEPPGWAEEVTRRGAAVRTKVTLGFCPENQKDGRCFLAWEGITLGGAGDGGEKFIWAPLSRRLQWDICVDTAGGTW